MLERNNEKKFLFLSLAGHIFCLGVLILAENKPVFPPVPKSGMPIEVEILDELPAKAVAKLSTNLVAVEKSSKEIRKKKKKIHLRDLIPKFNAKKQIFPDVSYNPKNSSGTSGALVKKETEGGNRRSVVNLDPKSSTHYRGFSKNGVFGVMNSLGVEELSPMMPFFEFLWKKIDESIGFPEDFAKQRITGQVSLHLSINKDGTFDGHFLKVKSANLLLETYVIASLLHVLENPIPKMLWLKDYRSIPVLIVFDFKTFSIVGEKGQASSGPFKNSMIFERRKYIDPKLNEAIEKIFTKYVPPIIPVPGGFFIDFVSAYKMIKGIGEPTEEERRLTRLNQLREKLKSTIKKKGRVNNAQQRS